MTIIQNGNNDPRRTHEIGGSAQTSRASRAQAGGSGEAPAATPNAALQVSAQGERFVSLRARLERLDVTRAERVERLRQAVADGRYQPDSQATAGAMLADPATAAALGMRTTPQQ